MLQSNQGSEDRLVRDRYPIGVVLMPEMGSAPDLAANDAGRYSPYSPRGLRPLFPRAIEKCAAVPARRPPVSLFDSRRSADGWFMGPPWQSNPPPAEPGAPVPSPSALGLGESQVGSGGRMLDGGKSLQPVWLRARRRQTGRKSSNYVGLGWLPGSGECADLSVAAVARRVVIAFGGGAKSLR